MLGSCVNSPEPVNPKFAVTFSEAENALREMKASPVKLSRPLVIIGGFFDHNFSPPYFTHRFKELSGDDRIIPVSIGMCGSFDECRRRVIEAVEERYPSADPKYTVEVDVVGASLGGLVARYAAAQRFERESVGGNVKLEDMKHEEKRLRVARIFSIASPHAGATLAQKIAFTQFHRDMRPGSAFITWLAEQDRFAAYELYPYVRLADEIVGDKNAAPPDRAPLWLANPPLHLSHAGAMTDARIIADIARRLRGESAFAEVPGMPLPQ
jgi:pimeloyl-ACP methyl ester carboxylesterase